MGLPLSSRRQAREHHRLLPLAHPQHRDRQWFLGKALAGLKEWDLPDVINTDKAPTYAVALAGLKQEGKCPKGTVHRQAKYLNNVVEADHGKLKQLIKPVRGFKTLRTAYATIKGFEVMRALRKGQASAFNVKRDICGYVHNVTLDFSRPGKPIANARHLRGTTRSSKCSTAGSGRSA